MLNFLFEQIYYSILTESLSYSDAVKIFQKYSGENVTNFSQNELNSLKRKLILKYHPDKNPNRQTEMTIISSEINAAYDILKNKIEKPKDSFDYTSHFTKQKKYDYKDEDEWSWAGHSGGIPNSTSGWDQVGNLNYYKKKSWEISGKPKRSPLTEYTFYPFDGNFFRNSITVLAVEDKLFEISNFVIEWNKFYNIKAVFYRRMADAPNIIYLINNNGEEVIPPKKFEHRSFNLNPSNDPNFEKYLRQMF